MRWASREPHERPSGRRASNTRERHGPCTVSTGRNQDRLHRQAEDLVPDLVGGPAGMHRDHRLPRVDLWDRVRGRYPDPGPRPRGRAAGRCSQQRRRDRGAIRARGEGADDAQIQVVTNDEGRGVTVQSKEIADPEAQERAVDIVSETVGAPISDIEARGSEASGEARSPDRRSRTHHLHRRGHRLHLLAVRMEDGRRRRWSP